MINVKIGKPTKSELNRVFRLRYQKLAELRYINTECFPMQLERDSWDDDPDTLHIVAKEGRQISAYTRITRAETLQAEKFFNFNIEDIRELRKVDRKRLQIAELSRLLIFNDSSPNLILHILKAVAKTSIELNIYVIFFVIKEDLIRTFESFKLPINHVACYTNANIDDVPAAFIPMFAEIALPTSCVYLLVKNMYQVLI